MVVVPKYYCWRFLVFAIADGSEIFKLTTSNPTGEYDLRSQFDRRKTSVVDSQALRHQKRVIIGGVSFYEICCRVLRVPRLGKTQI